MTITIIGIIAATFAVGMLILITSDNR